MSDVLQFFGGFFELLGLVTVGLGIVETRRAFTNRPGVLQKVARAVAGFVARLTRRKGRTVHAGGISVSGGGDVSVSARVGYGFQGSPEERLSRVQEIVQRHEDRLSELGELLKSESGKLRTEIEALRDVLRNTEQRLMERIGEAAANGLTLESWGVFLFIVGVALTTWGGLIA